MKTKAVKIETFANGKLYNIGGIEVKPSSQESDTEIRFQGLMVKSSEGQITVERIPYGST